MKKILISLIFMFVIGITVVAIHQLHILGEAHSSFDNYYAFRGCKQLVKKTNTSGVCKLSSGKEIQIVQFHGLWYLDGDLPTCNTIFCF